MQAEQFYQSNTAQKTIPIQLISQQQWKESEQWSKVEHNCFAVQQFKARIGDCCLQLDDKGLLEKAYIGVGNDQYYLALAHAATCLPPDSYHLMQSLSLTELAQWGLAQYRFTQYKKSDRENRVLFLTPEQHSAVLQEVNATFLVRDLINAPTNSMGPKHLAQVAEDLAHRFQAKFQQWVGEELLNANFPAIYYVGCASANAPRLLHLTWGNPKHSTIALVGKGVCFDSGGLDIKPYNNMRFMKKDMAGAAHVLGLAQWIMERHLPIYLHVLIPAVENAIGPNAYRPGDILTMRNGLTVEVDNTDAEGRLILADALTKAAEMKPELILNFATLTGAARVAVGTEIAAMFTNDNTLATTLTRLSETTQDTVCQLPLHPGYESMLDSPIADLANCSDSPYAGAIVAALFLKRFVPNSISWAHFDIMAWNIRSKPGKPEGGEALGLRTVAYFLEKKYGGGCYTKSDRGNHSF